MDLYSSLVSSFSMLHAETLMSGAWVLGDCDVYTTNQDAIEKWIALVWGMSSNMKLWSGSNIIILVLC